MSAVTNLRRRQAAHALRRLRVELGLSQERAAALCGVSPRTWGAWERATVPLRALEALLILQAYPITDGRRPSVSGRGQPAGNRQLETHGTYTAYGVRVTDAHLRRAA